MKLVFAILVFVAVMPKIVFAYLDPGSGSYLLQLILGTLLGAVYFFRNFIGKFKDYVVSFIKKVFKRK